MPHSGTEPPSYEPQTPTGRRLAVRSEFRTLTEEQQLQLETDLQAYIQGVGLQYSENGEESRLAAMFYTSRVAGDIVNRLTGGTLGATARPIHKPDVDMADVGEQAEQGQPETAEPDKSGKPDAEDGPGQPETAEPGKSGEVDDEDSLLEEVAFLAKKKKKKTAKEKMVNTNKPVLEVAFDSFMAKPGLGKYINFLGRNAVESTFRCVSRAVHAQATANPSGSSTKLAELILAMQGASEAALLAAKIVDYSDKPAQSVKARLSSLEEEAHGPIFTQMIKDLRLSDQSSPTSLEKDVAALYYGYRYRLLYMRLSVLSRMNPPVDFFADQDLIGKSSKDRMGCVLDIVQAYTGSKDFDAQHIYRGRPTVHLINEYGLGLIPFLVAAKAKFSLLDGLQKFLDTVVEQIDLHIPDLREMCKVFEMEIVVPVLMGNPISLDTTYEIESYSAVKEALSYTAARPENAEDNVELAIRYAELDRIRMIGFDAKKTVSRFVSRK